MLVFPGHALLSLLCGTVHWRADSSLAEAWNVLPYSSVLCASGCTEIAGPAFLCHMVSLST